MGSCFKFKMCRKRAYDFNSQPYEPAPVPTGTYRASTVEVEGWDPNVALAAEPDKPSDKEQAQVNGETHEDVTQETKTAVVSSPSNSDVTFGGNLANDQHEEENEKESKSSKKKKEKEKKSKKEKSKKKSKSKKKKGKDDDADNTENEMIEKENEGEKSEKKDDTGDISNMETLPRDEKHTVTVAETTTVMAAGETEIKETSVSNTYEVETADDSEENNDKHTKKSGDNDDTQTQDVDSGKEGAIPQIVVEETNPEVHVVSTTIITETNSATEGKRTSSFGPTNSDEESDRGFEKRREEEAEPYPSPDEQIDVMKTDRDLVVNGDITEEGGTLIERTTKTVQERSNNGGSVTVTKVITETIEKHGDVGERISTEISDELAKF